jgi:integrase
MSWAEVDLDAATWTIPAARMKAGKLHRVPLTEAALDLLRKQARIEGEELVFPNYRGGPLSDMAMTQTCRRLGGKCVPHGMRSTFRDWVAERTNYPGELAEMQLAHAIGNRVEAAYRRGDMFEKRRAMMNAWAAFVAIPEVKGDVVSINSAVAA